MAITKIHGMNWLRCMQVDCSKQYNNFTIKAGDINFLNLLHFSVMMMMMFDGNRELSVYKVNIVLWLRGLFN